MGVAKDCAVGEDRSPSIFRAVLMQGGGEWDDARCAPVGTIDRVLLQFETNMQRLRRSMGVLSDFLQHSFW